MTTNIHTRENAVAFPQIRNETGMKKMVNFGGFLPFVAHFHIFVVVPFLPFTIFTLYNASVNIDQMRGKG